MSDKDISVMSANSRRSRRDKGALLDKASVWDGYCHLLPNVRGELRQLSREPVEEVCGCCATNSNGCSLGTKECVCAGPEYAPAWHILTSLKPCRSSHRQCLFSSEQAHSEWPADTDAWESIMGYG